MPVIFKCKNKDCDKYPCQIRCDAAYMANDFGDDSVDTPDTCPYAEETGEEAKFAPVWKAGHPDFQKQNELEEWYTEHEEEFPQEVRDTEANGWWYGRKGNVDFETVMKFTSMMFFEATENYYFTQESMDRVCKSFTKQELLIAALYRGYRMGLLQGYKLMWDKQNGKGDEE